jgi:AcrR family transcriptional regulator
MGAGSKRKVRAPQQQRAQDTAAAIVEGAARILEREGMEALTTARIAEAAGVGVGSIYEYFESKDAIIAALCRRHLDEVRALMDHGFDSLAHVPIELAVLPFVRALFDLHSVRPRLRRVILQQLPAHLSAPVLAGIDAHVAARLTTYLQGQRHALRSPDVEMLAWTVARAGRGVSLAFTMEGRAQTDRARVEAALVDMVLRTLLP